MPLHSGAPLPRCRTRSVASVPSSAAGGMAGLFERSGSAAASVLYLVVTGACLLGLLQLGGLLWGGRSGLYPCKPDNEGQWSIGLYRGPSPFALQPLELAQPPASTDGAWPVSNPVFTCAHVTDKHSSFVADPFIWPMPDGKTVYMFFETKSLHNMQGDIGAAVSQDGGLTFKHVGVVLDEPWHLSYPFLLEDKGKMYMVPEVSNSGTLRLYEATRFPDKWQLSQVLIEQPLIDASFVQQDGKWWIFASNRREKSSKNCRELEIWYADGLKGPWTRHPGSPVRSWVQGSRLAGRPVRVDGQLYRFGQECEYTYGYKVRAFRVKKLSTTEYEEEEVPFGLNGTRRPGVDWNGQRYHHIDAHQLPDGSWLAAMDGDKYVSDYITHRWLRRLPWLLPAGLLLLATLVFTLYKGGPGPALAAACPHALLRSCCCCYLGGSGGGGGYSGSGIGAAGDVESKGGVRKRSYPGAGGAVGVLYSLLGPREGLSPRGGSVGGVGGVWEVLGRRLPTLTVPGGLLLGGCTLAQLLVMVAVIAALPWFIWTFCRLQILAGLLWYVRTFSGSPEPHLVSGSFSKFSILVMSYEARLITLQAFVQHYSQCSSVGEIVVVWNKGAPPDPVRDLGAGGVPVRIRAEAANSMNNRFRPDAELKNRGILMLDDDIIMPCADIERGFAKWRKNPERVTGYYSRILEGDPPQYQCIKGCEHYTYSKGRFNIVLAGAAFMDSHLVFPAYYSDRNKEGRAYVDRVFNCDDLLLNYLMASELEGKQYAQYVRPTKRFDVGKLTSKRLSTGNFGPVRHNCTRDFAAMFGNPLKDVSFPIDWDGLGQPTCGPSWLGCLFI